MAMIGVLKVEADLWWNDGDTKKVCRASAGTGLMLLWSSGLANRDWSVVLDA